MLEVQLRRYSLARYRKAFIEQGMPKFWLALFQIHNDVNNIVPTTPTTQVNTKY